MLVEHIIYTHDGGMTITAVGGWNAGNRNGTFYAIHTSGANEGEMAWQYETDGATLYSAAYDSNTVYFASNTNPSVSEPSPSSPLAGED